MIIGISGKMGCGKSVLTERLLLALSGYTRIGFADILKKECADKFNFPLDCCYRQEGKRHEVKVDLKHFEDVPHPYGISPGEELRGHKYMTVRELLQWYGTDVCQGPRLLGQGYGGTDR